MRGTQTSGELQRGREQSRNAPLPGACTIYKLSVPGSVKRG
jgi:hypothetical protein